MGCWNETCDLSHLQIFSGDKIKLLFLFQVGTDIRTCYYNESYAPLCLPIDGVYNDYGGIEKVNVSDYTLNFLSKLKLLSKEKKDVFAKEDEEDVFTEYKFKDVETLLFDIMDGGNIYLEYGCCLNNKLKLTYAFYHKELYDILVEDFKKRKVYGEKETIYELHKKKLDVVKTDLFELDRLNKILKQNPKDEDALFKKMDLNWNLRDKIFKTSQFSLSFPYQYVLLNVLDSDNIDDYHKELLDYIMFARSLILGRYGYGSISGMGGQDADVRVQELIAKFILKFIKRTYEDGGKMYTKKETIFWYD